jgi:hypothetical protein
MSTRLKKDSLETGDKVFFGLQDKVRAADAVMFKAETSLASLSRGILFLFRMGLAACSDETD